MEDEAIFCQICGAKNETEDLAVEKTTVLNANDISSYIGGPQNTKPIKSKNNKLSKGAIIAIVLTIVIVIVGVSITTGVLIFNKIMKIHFMM